MWNSLHSSYSSYAGVLDLVLHTVASAKIFLGDKPTAVQAVSHELEILMGFILAHLTVRFHGCHNPKWPKGAEERVPDRVLTF